MYICIFEAESYAFLAGLELTVQSKLSDHRAPLLPLECWDYHCFLLILLMLQLLISGPFFPRNEAQEEIYKKGQSKRIWGELYKVRLMIFPG